MDVPSALDLARSAGVSCLSITDPGDSDIIRSLPGQVEPEFQLVNTYWIGEHPLGQQHHRCVLYAVFLFWF